MLIKIALIVALIIFISRKYFQKSMQPKTRSKHDDIIDAEFTEIKDDSSKDN